MEKTCSPPAVDVSYEQVDIYDKPLGIVCYCAKTSLSCLTQYIANNALRRVNLARFTSKALARYWSAMLPSFANTSYCV